MNNYEDIKRRIEYAKKTRFNDFILGLFVMEISCDESINKAKADELYEILGYNSNDHEEDLQSFEAYEFEPEEED